MVLPKAHSKSYRIQAEKTLLVLKAMEISNQLEMGK